MCTEILGIPGFKPSLRISALEGVEITLKRIKVKSKSTL
jgi:hypothetical protein